jgi:hypothetical protein
MDASRPEAAACKTTVARSPESASALQNNTGKSPNHQLNQFGVMLSILISRPNGTKEILVNSNNTDQLSRAGAQCRAMLGYFGGDWLHVTSIESCVSENHVAGS